MVILLRYAYTTSFPSDIVRISNKLTPIDNWNT